MRSENIVKSFGYAFAGIWYSIRTQRNAKIHIVIAAILISLAVFLQSSATDIAILVLTFGLVFAAEMSNTAIESMVDLTSPNLHPLAKISKDVAAGAVLAAALAEAAVGFIILGPPLWQYLFG